MACGMILTWGKGHDMGEGTTGGGDMTWGRGHDMGEGT